MRIRDSHRIARPELVERPQMDCVVVTYNSAADLRGFADCKPMLDAFERVIVVDNGSTDDSIEIAREAGFDIIQRDTNDGYAAAANVGIRAATGPFVALLNPDIRVDDSTLFDHLESHFDDARVAVAAPALVLPDGSLQDSARSVPRPHELAWRRWAQAEHGMIRSDRPTNVPWVVGACLVIRRTAFNAVNGFDPSYPLYFEDVDFCVRLGEAGWSTVFDPTIAALHFHRGDSRRSLFGPSTRRHARSAARFYYQHPRYILGLSA
ncbi:MAG: glycosyltransferase family 2 protein [Thermoleophilaceae bacterium]|nr:glycosyltransferase family 2 protein [Thermoleophilaceae bacterium]